MFHDLAATFGVSNDFDDSHASAADAQNFPDLEFCPRPACSKTRDDGGAIARRMDHENV
jgi:hypothetical protein